MSHIKLKSTHLKTPEKEESSPKQAALRCRNSLELSKPINSSDRKIKLLRAEKKAFSLDGKLDIFKFLDLIQDPKTIIQTSPKALFSSALAELKTQKKRQASKRSD